MSEALAITVAPAAVPAALILEAALRKAAQTGWDRLQLHELAAELGLPLGTLALHYADKNALAQALFDRADQSMWAACEAPGWRALEATARLEQALFAWFEPLAPHRRVVGQMLRYPLQPEHVHLQLQGLLRISRTVQWWREVAALNASGLRRELLEVVLTGIYLNTFAAWLADETLGARRARRWLGWQLGLARASPLGAALR